MGLNVVKNLPETTVAMAQVAKAEQSAMFGAGFAISLPLGSFVSNDYGWRWTYRIYYKGD